MSDEEREAETNNHRKVIFVGGGALAALVSICCVGAVVMAFVTSSRPFQDDLEVFCELNCEKSEECDEVPLKEDNAEECTENCIEIFSEDVELSEMFDACGTEFIEWVECWAELSCRDIARDRGCVRKEKNLTDCQAAAGFE